MANPLLPRSFSAPQGPHLTSTNLALVFALLVALSYGSSALHAQSVSFAGAQSTLAGAGGFSAAVGLPTGLAVDQAGDVFIAASGSGQVFEIPAGGGTPVALASGFAFGTPCGVALDTAGNVYVADPGYSGGAAVIEIPAGGSSPQVVQVNGGLIKPIGVALDGQGDLFILDAGNGSVLELPAALLPAGGTANSVGNGLLSLVSPTGIAADAAGDGFIADSGQTSIVEVLEDASVQSLGTGLSSPSGIALDAAGDVFIANGNATIVEISAGGVQTTDVFSGNVPAALGVVVDGKDNIFVADTAS